MGKYIGQILGERSVCIGDDSPNQHLVLTGVSGSGKSVRLADIESHAVKDGGTVIAFDVNGTHPALDIEDCQYIPVPKEKLSVSLLSTRWVDKGEETFANLVVHVVDVLSPKQMRGARQLVAMRTAVEFAIRNRERFADDMEAIAYGLKQQEDLAAVGAYNQLYTILEGEVFGKSTKTIEGGKVNIISLQGVEPNLQKKTIDILLKSIWRQLRMEGAGQRNITLVLDEFQSLDFGQGTVLFQMLTEVRKYGVGLLLATQTLSIFSRKELSIINQASTKLFFQQTMSDARKIADLIEPQHQEKWVRELPRLRVGQAIAVGALELEKRKINQPVITYSAGCRNM